jgi:hypothetical protein
VRVKLEDQALAAYEAILDGVGARAEEMGPRPLVSHWPHQGSAYRSGGLFFAGQALDGWDSALSSARWWPADARTSSGRKRILAGTRSWHTDLDEPIQGVLQYPNRRRSSFWTLARDVVNALVPDSQDPWYSRFVWGNVYPIGYDKRADFGMRAGSPTGALKDVQDPYVGDLLDALVRMVDAKRIVIVSGPDYWREAEQSLDLGLAPAQFPLISTGRSDGRSWVVGYHPTYSRKAGKRLHGPGAGSNAYYVAAVEQAFDELGKLFSV